MRTGSRGRVFGSSGFEELLGETSEGCSLSVRLIFKGNMEMFIVFYSVLLHLSLSPVAAAVHRLHHREPCSFLFFF